MRITSSTLTNNFLSNLNKNAEELSKLQTQLSSGSQIEKPSDDPVAVSKIMYLNTAIERNEQYESNIDDAVSWNTMTDVSLENIGDILQSVREITVQAANDTYSDSDRQALADSVDQMIEQIVQDANTMYDSRYLFGGTNNKEVPFEITDDGEVQYNGNDEELNVQVSPTLEIPINTSGNKLNSTCNLFDTLVSVKKALETNDTDALSGEVLDDIDESIEGILNLRAQVGSRINRFESILEKNQAETLNMTEIVSEEQDVDLAEKIMEYTQMQTVYDATLSAGAKIIQNTLLDYL
jgi:flagellar hook-associated protein 3 FlgL